MVAIAAGCRCDFWQYHRCNLKLFLKGWPGIATNQCKPKWGIQRWVQKKSAS